MCLYQTEPNRASNEASVYVYLNLYAVMSQPSLLSTTKKFLRPLYKDTFATLLLLQSVLRFAKNTIIKCSFRDILFLCPFFIKIPIAPLKSGHMTKMV